MDLKSVYQSSKNVIFLVGAMVWIVFFFIPIPAVMITYSIIFLMAFSLLVLFRAVSIKDWSDIRTFPLILLFSTLFRIGLSIATTRKIISGESPGSFIESAGHFLVGDNVLIGFVIFIIVIVVQFIIANGSSRFGEVAARFALDGLPGKQMSIDNELTQGVIDEETAKKRKRKLELQTDFYGNLDGAGKYIKGDVWANVVMVVINLVVGMIVGMAMLDMTFSEAANTFTILTVGDGVVNTICALIITGSGAFIMAKVEDEEDDRKGQTVIQKILLDIIPNSTNLYIVGTLFVGLSFTPLPTIPLLVSGAGFIGAGYYLHKIRKEEEEEEFREKMENTNPENQGPQIIKVQHTVDDIRLEVGYKLANLFNGSSGGETIQNHVLKMRQMFAEMYGVEIPAIKIKDDVMLYPSTKYVIKIKESVVASGVLKEDKALAIPTSLVIGEIEGELTKDPVNGREAYWITEDKIDEAGSLGYDVWDPLTIIATHLHVMVLQHVHSLIDLQKVSDMVEEVGDEKPILKKMIEKQDDIHLLHKVIVSLLRERVSIKDLSTILEGYLDARRTSEEVDSIVEVVRQRISRQLCEMNINRDGYLYALMLDPMLEETLPTKNYGGSYVLEAGREVQEKLVAKIKEEIENAKALRLEPVIVVHTMELRPALSKLIQSFEIPISVLSVYEVPTSVPNKIIGYIKLTDE